MDTNAYVKFHPNRNNSLLKKSVTDQQGELLCRYLVRQNKFNDDDEDIYFPLLSSI